MNTRKTNKHVRGHNGLTRTTRGQQNGRDRLRAGRQLIGASLIWRFPGNGAAAEGNGGAKPRVSRMVAFIRKGRGAIKSAHLSCQSDHVVRPQTGSGDDGGPKGGVVVQRTTLAFGRESPRGGSRIRVKRDGNGSGRPIAIEARQHSKIR